MHSPQEAVEALRYLLAQFPGPVPSTALETERQASTLRVVVMAAKMIVEETS